MVSLGFLAGAIDKLVGPGDSEACYWLTVTASSILSAATPAVVVIFILLAPFSSATVSMALWWNEITLFLLSNALS